MPLQSELPDNLAKLARRNAIELRDLRWQNDVEELINVMDRVLTEREKARLAKAASEAEERERQQVKVNEEKQRAIEKARLEAQERVALLEKRTAEEHDRPQESTLNGQIESDSADLVQGVEPFHSLGKSGSNGVSSSVAMSHSPSDSIVVAPQLSGAVASRSAVAATTQSRKYRALAFISLAVGILIIGGLSIWLTKSRLSANSQVITEQQSRVAPPNINATASSKRSPFRTFTYEAANAVDGRLDTAWIEGVDDAGVGEWIRFDFGREVILHRITIHPGYFKDDTVWKENNRLAAVTLQLSDGSSRELSFLNAMKSVSTSVGAVKISWARLAITKIYDGSKPGPHNDTALSEVVFEYEPTDTGN